MKLSRTFVRLSVLVSTIALVYAESDDSFVFPDEMIVESKSRFGGGGYYGNRQFNNQRRRPYQNGFHGSSNYDNYGNNYDNNYPHNFNGQNGFGGINNNPYSSQSGFGGHPVYNQQARPWQGPSHGIINKNPSIIHGNNGGSFTNAESNAQASNGYANSNSQANSQSQYQGGWNNPGSSSASSAASATTGIVNGYPVAAASSAAAAAAAGGNNSGGGLSSSLAMSSALAGNRPGGFNQIYNQNNNISPWAFRSRIGGDDDTDAAAKEDEKKSKNNDTKSEKINEDSITFQE